MEMEVKFSNIKAAQAIVLKKMFEDMEYLGKLGCSRFLAFNSDGDGDFRPKVEITTSEPLPDIEYQPNYYGDKMGERSIHAIPYDYDSLAWKLRQKEE